MAQVRHAAVAPGAGLAYSLGCLQGLRRKNGQQAPGAHGCYGGLMKVDEVHGVPKVELRNIA